MNYYNCACCGKRFPVYGAWGYAYDGMYTCSYHCMRQMRREDLEGTEGPMKKHIYTDEERLTIAERRAAGASCHTIAEELGLNEWQISEFCKRHGIKAAGRTEAAAGRAETANEAPATEEAAVEILEKAKTEHVDPVRLINAICDALQLLRMLYEKERA